MELLMSWEELSKYDATALADLIEKKEITAKELADQTVIALDAVNPDVNAIIEIFHDVVENPEKDGLNSDGYFSGIPYLMKDLGPTLKGRLQEMGSFLMQGNRSTTDSFLTKKIRNAGLNIIGRTTTPEFGICSSAENPDLYRTRNPWNVNYSSCGSSAGSAVAVATGSVAIAHGSDGGGSIRIPAGTNGLIGLKPSRGVFTNAPAGSDLTNVVATQGCLTRTIRDTAAFFDHCRGGAPGEFLPYWNSGKPYTEVIKKDPGKLRIAVSYEWGEYKSAPNTVEQLKKAASHLESLGHYVEWIKPDIDFNGVYEAQTDSYITNFAFTINELIKTKGYDTPPEDLVEPVSRNVWKKGSQMTYLERGKMQLLFNEVSRKLGDFFTHWDIILTPTIAGETPLIGMTKYLTISNNPSVRDWFRDLWRMYAFTPMANVSGIPGISLPMGEMENGMPLGIQALSGLGNDGLLLQLGAQIERSLNGKWNHGRTPNIHVTNI